MMMNKLTIERLNKEMEEALRSKYQRRYKRYISAINAELVNLVNPTKEKAKEIIKRHTLKIDDIVVIETIMGSVTQILSNPQAEEKHKDDLLIGALFLASYSLTRPKSFVKRIINVADGEVKSNRERLIRRNLNNYKSRKEVLIKTTTRNIHTRIERNRLASTNNIFKDVRKLKRQQLTPIEMRQQLRTKYVSRVKIQRALATELNEIAETTKLNQMQDMGYRTKTWNVRDEEYRKTAFHSSVKGATIPINEKFDFAGEQAMHPSDNSLSAGERINCRCYLTFD